MAWQKVGKSRMLGLELRLGYSLFLLENIGLEKAILDMKLHKPLAP